MKIFKLFLSLAIVAALFACKTEVKKEVAPKVKQEVAATQIESTSFSISGMTCEIGCAKKIASDLSKKDGVLDAKVIFTDSIAKIKYDATKTSKADLMAFVNGIAENMYTTAEIDNRKCKPDCKKKCTAKEGVGEKACKADCKMACCAKEEAKACKKTCKTKCCTEKEGVAKICADACKKEACCTTVKKA